MYITAFHVWMRDGTGAVEAGERERFFFFQHVWGT